MNPPPPPPPPPPHGAAPPPKDSKRGGLPDGNYDIFIIPPHSAGSGFLYLPSLQPHRNSFLAGVGCTLLVVAVWIIVLPVLKQWLATIIASGGMGVVVLMAGMGVAGWAWGKTQMENGRGPHTGGSGPSGYQHNHAEPPPQASAPPPQQHQQQPPPPPPPPQPEYNTNGTHPKPSWSQPAPGTGRPTGGAGAAKSAWEKAREETKRKEEERKKAEEVRKRVEELRKKREEEEKERQRQREQEARERELRERREREAKERAERAERMERERAERAERAERERAERAERASAAGRASPHKAHQPTARTEADEESYSYRPYDTPKAKTTSASSVYSGSYAQSQSTARSTPPPSHRGPYTTKDPDKIILKAVYTFTNAHQKTPVSQLVSGAGAVTDGLILRITTEGLFIDDDVRGVPQREWDIKAWTMKFVETAEYKRTHVLRATIRDQEGKRYVFVLPEEESWKVTLGLQRLKKGSQAKGLATSGLPANECKNILEHMGWA